MEWSREEDEKLLHLAKMLPSQWKTIGPLIGRTATQSQERYERLLDEAAAAASGAAEEDSKPAAVALPTAGQSARKLRPGEIDPHPETKPARPDPIDMDEDEIEMLQEARARLANTQGKKAKRKQREKMLAEAKRLADLQKRRELKQAGLLSGEAAKKSKKRSREIDLGVEIPFHKPAPAGFHDTVQEKVVTEAARAKRLKDVDYKKINEDQYRTRDREAKAAHKREEARLRALERANMQLAVAEVSKKSDPIQVRNRGMLNMPAPTVSDSELEQVAKLSSAMQHSDMPPPPPRGGVGASVTDALLGDYTDRPLPTPMRTPAYDSASSNQGAMSKADSIRREAENLRRIERGETPLLGGINPELNAGATGTGASLNDASGSKPTVVDAVTLARTAPTPQAVGASSFESFTPALERGLVSQTPLAVVRDELGLNRPSAKQPQSQYSEDASIMGGDASTFGGGTTTGWSLRELAREERRAAKRARKEMEEALAALPAPQFEYDLAVPEIVSDDNEEDEAVQRKMEKDQAEIDAEERRRWEKEAAKMYEARSSVLKREGELPRPLASMTSIPEEYSGESKEYAEVLLQEEMLKLLRHDAHAHPVFVYDAVAIDVSGDQSKKSKKKTKKRSATSTQSTPLDYIAEEDLDAAKELLLQETERLLEEKRKAIAEELASCLAADLDHELKQQNVASSIEGATGSADSTKQRRLAEIKAEFDALNEVTEAMKKKNDKMEQKLTVLVHGYQKRADGLCDSILQRYSEFRHSQIEEAVYRNLQTNEQEAIVRRPEKLEEEVKELEKMESSAQKRYGDLIHERNRLWKRATRSQKPE